MSTVVSLHLLFADGTDGYAAVTKLPDEYQYIGPKSIATVEADPVRVPVIEIDWVEAA